MTGPPGGVHYAIERPLWAGGGAGRVYGYDLVTFDADGTEVDRRYIEAPSVGGDYPFLSGLQATVDDVNKGNDLLDSPSLE